MRPSEAKRIALPTLPSGSTAKLSDRAGLAEIDDIQVSAGVDGRPLDAEGVFAGWRELPALEGRFLRDRRGCDHKGDRHLAKQPGFSVRSHSYPSTQRSIESAGHEIRLKLGSSFGFPSTPITIML